MSLLGPPPAPDHLRIFPTYELRDTSTLTRIHSRRRQPWYFSSSLAGRFDLRAPNGACYLAETHVGAFIEVFQRWIAQRIPIPRSELATRHCSELSVPAPLRLADLAHPHALQFGVTGLIHTSPDRALTQAWAASFHTAGFDGVRYLVSTAASMRYVGVAVFHAGGEAAWPVTATGSIPETLIVEIEREFGVLVR